METFQLKDSFERKKILTKTLRVRTQPWACVRIINSYVCNHKPMYAARDQETPIRQVFYKVSAEAIPHLLEFPPSLLFEHYKRPPRPFFQRHKICSKKIDQGEWSKSSSKKLLLYGTCYCFNLFICLFLFLIFFFVDFLCSLGLLFDHLERMLGCLDKVLIGVCLLCF